MAEPASSFLLGMWPIWISLAVLWGGSAVALCGKNVPPIWRLWLGLAMLVLGAVALPFSFWVAWRLHGVR